MFFQIPDKVTVISSSRKRLGLLSCSHILLLLRGIAATFPWGRLRLQCGATRAENKISSFGETDESI